jgi:hypothetical protein
VNIDNAEIRATPTVIRAEKDGHWADLELSYEWAKDGSSFNVVTTRYRAQNNDRRSGNIKLKLVSRGDTGWNELNNDDGIQDGQWHAFFGYFLRVDGNQDTATIHFNWIFDNDNDSDTNMTGAETTLFTPLTPYFENKQRNFPTRIFRVTGMNGISPEASIQLYRVDNDSAIGDPAVPNELGWWSTEISLSPGAIRIYVYARQQFYGKWSSKSSASAHLYVAEIKSPAPNAVMVQGDKISGSAADGSTVQVRRASDSAPMSPDVKVGAEGTWETELYDGIYGPISVKANFRLSTYPEVDTATVNYEVLGIPTIMGPAADSYQPVSFSLVGNNGLQGADIDVYLDLTDIKVGDGKVAVNSTDWDAEVTLEPGPRSLVVVQRKSGKSSGRSRLRSFKIAPNPPTLSFRIIGEGGEFYGEGFPGAEVIVHVKNGELVVRATVEPNRSWAKRTSSDFVPGTYPFDARQSVPDGSTGWIPSEWADTLTVTIPVPVPTLQVQVGEDRKPVFSGMGNRWAGKPATKIKVEVISGPSTPAIPDITVNDDKRWNYTSDIVWVPGSYSFRARQLFNTLESEWTSNVQLIIRAPMPTVNVVENVLTPQFHGGCLDGAEVTVWFDDDSASATVSGVTWTYTRPEPFMPGSYTVHVTQTINGQTSNKASLAFTVVVTKPVITSPIGGKVDHNPIIRGTAGIPGATMRVFDALTDGPLGNAAVTGNEWLVSILEDLSFGNHSIYAIQEYGGFPSEQSEEVTFEVILFPPSIDHPQEDENVARAPLIYGQARKFSGLDTATVELWLEGAAEPLTTVRAWANGYWEYNSQLPLGTYKLRAKQIFAGTPSDFSSDREFTVVPAVPVIESPAQHQHVGTMATLSGFGYAGDWVEVAWSDARESVLGRTQVQANRSWSLALPVDKPAGEQSWVVRQVFDEYSSAWSEVHPVRLLSSAPIFTAPEPGHWYAGLPVFQGSGETGKAIELSHWFDTRQSLSTGDEVVGGEWTASPDAPLRANSHWVKARQGDSAWGESARFEVDPTEHE